MVFFPTKYVFLARRKGALLTWALLACFGLEFSEDLLSMAGEDTTILLGYYLRWSYGRKGGRLGRFFNVVFGSAIREATPLFIPYLRSSRCLCFLFYLPRGNLR
jgi:hypothetical protein